MHEVSFDYIAFMVNWPDSDQCKDNPGPISPETDSKQMVKFIIHPFLYVG